MPLSPLGGLPRPGTPPGRPGARMVLSDLDGSLACSVGRADNLDRLLLGIHDLVLGTQNRL